MHLPHELGSDEYWARVDWVLQDPGYRPSNYSRPMFEEFDDEPRFAMREHEIEHCGDCLCL